MAYLERRIARLLEELRSGKLSLGPDVRAQFEEEIASVRYHPGGALDLASCSPWLRGVARAYTLAAPAAEEEADQADDDAPPSVRPERVAENNRELFRRFETVFEAVTGEPSAGFGERHGSFGSGMNALGRQMREQPRLARQRIERGEHALQELRKFYSATAQEQTVGAASLGGMKFVLGGGASTFHEAALRATRSMLLYCDSLVIPDPVLPWIEVPRDEEKFGRVKMLQNIAWLLQLAPLVEADLPQPPIVLYPSWDRTLDAQEDVQDAQERTALTFFSHYLGGHFEDIREVAAYVDAHETKFLEAVAKRRLFVAQGRAAGDELSAAIAAHRAALETSRSEAHMKSIRGLGDGRFVMFSILERLGPQYHASRSGEGLRAAPLFALPVHWHYFRLLARARKAGGEGGRTTEPYSGKGLTQRPLLWLGNVPVSELVELRRRGENASFRERISKHVLSLDEASFEEAPRVAAEVERAVESLLVEHQAELRKIAEEAEQRHKATAALTWVTLAASFGLTFLPAAAAVTAAVGFAAKYVADEVAIRTKRQQLRGTLLGALAAASEGSGD